MTTTTGTNTPAMTSARRWIGAFDPWASSTSLMIPASAVSAPMPVALQRSSPCALIVAAYTGLPAVLLTGRLSPVSSDSSILELPSITLPSTGTASPGRTMKVSPTRNCATGISRTSPLRSTRAVCGCNRISSSIAAEARARARDSSNLPRNTSVMMLTAASK